MSGSTSFDTTYTTLWRARLLHPVGGLDGASDARLALCVRRCHADVDRSPSSRAAAAFALAGSPIARNALVTELGVNYAIGPSATIGIAYSGQYSSGANENWARRISPCTFEGADCGTAILDRPERTRNDGEAQHS